MIRTYLAVAAMVIYIFLNTLIFLPIILILDEKTGVKLTKKVKKYYGHFVMWLIKAKVEVKYRNKENFDSILEKEPVVVVANHQSFIDIPLILGYLPINVGFVAKEEIRKWHLFNLWMDRAQCVFLDRSSSKKALESFKAAIKFISDGKSVCVFPEGTRTFDGKVGEFKKGTFKLAVEPKVKIIPVTIKGTYEIMNKHKFYIRRGLNIVLTVGEVIDTTQLQTEELNKINDKVRDEIVANLGSF